MERFSRNLGANIFAKYSRLDVRDIPKHVSDFTLRKLAHCSLKYLFYPEQKCLAEKLI